MTSQEHHAAARRRGEVRKAGRDRQVGRAIDARRDFSNHRGGRAWINGKEVGGADSRYLHLSRSYD
jgi:hypothetical protein